MAPRSLLRKALHVDHDFVHEDRLILRDHLALVRTRLANERTLMSYIRSALYLLLGGIALLKLKSYVELHLVGYLALGLCVLILVVGIYRYIRLRRHLTQYYKAWQEEAEKHASIADADQEAP
jgi:putative membrane protein